MLSYSHGIATHGGSKIKHCPRCLRRLDDSRFYGNRSNRDGLDNYCKDCKKSYNNDRYISAVQSSLYSFEELRYAPSEWLLEFLKVDQLMAALDIPRSTAGEIHSGETYFEDWDIKKVRVWLEAQS